MSGGMTESGGWDRVESMGRTIELTGGLEARVPDPLWMLARQWQVGEFKGDDAAQPAGVRLRGRSAPLATFLSSRPGATPVPFPAGTPLEAQAEATPEPEVGSARLYVAARAGRTLVRLLRDAGLGPAVETALRKAFPLAEPAHRAEAGASNRVAAALLVRRAVDGVALARAEAATVARALVGLPAGDAARTTAVIDRWREWYGRRGGLTVESTWDDERLEYAFSLGVRGPAGEVVLDAPEHPGGHLDWYTFDVTSAATHGLTAAPLEPRVITGLPTPLRFPGMPASRWWEFEDAAVSFGDLDAGPADLARLLVAEFVVAYGDDWWLLPVPVPVGSLTELAALEVVDTFGGVTPVPSTAHADFVRTEGASRAWRMFELTGDEVGDGHPSPWLFLPPTPVGGLEGPALERVALARDEGANMAWGVERLVEGALGRAVDRAEAWDVSRPAPSPIPTGAAMSPAGASDWWWRYRVEATAPPWWIPLAAERIEAGSVEVRLRRSRMQPWSLLDPALAGPQSMLLDPRRPRWLYEEEVPRSGISVERSWQYARWHDGSVHVWLQRRKRPGRGDKASGVRWDLLELQAGAPEPHDDIASPSP